MLLEQIHRLFEHAAWADALVAEAIQKQDNVADDTIELFAHILGAEEVWLSRLEQRPSTLAVWPKLDRTQLAATAARIAQAYRSYLSRLTQNDLLSEVPYKNSIGQAFRTPIGEILMHVAMHGSYHRGQVALRMRRDGATPAPTDYIAFIRGVPAATRQS
ncbi:MAG: DinB family protein [Gemmatimonadaceae bacterium]